MRASLVRPCGALFVLLGAVLAFAGPRATAAESMPAGSGPPVRIFWSTTFDCPESSQSNGYSKDALACDGLQGHGGWKCDLVTDGIRVPGEEVALLRGTHQSKFGRQVRRHRRAVDRAVTLGCLCRFIGLDVDANQLRRAE